MRQGCPLKPILFNIYINDLEQELRRRREEGALISPETGVKVYALLYADDAAIIADRLEELSKMLVTL